MKLKTLALALVLVTTGSMIPIKEAKAGLIIGNFAVSMIGWVPWFGSGMISAGTGKGAKGARLIISLAGMGLFFLDSDLDSLEVELSERFPSIPSYVINELAELARIESHRLPFNDHNLKEVILDEELVDEVIALANGSDEAEIKALKSIFTTSVTNK